MLNNQVTKYLASYLVKDQLDKLVNKFKIEKNQEGIIDIIIKEYVQGKIKQEDIALVLEKKANFDFNTALELSLDLYNGVLTQIPSDLTQKADTEDTGAIKSPLIGISLTAFLDSIKSTAGLKIRKDHEKRYTNFVFNWIRDIRDDLETIDVLTKEVKNGGLGLKPDKAQEILNVLKQNEIQAKEQGIDILGLISQQLAEERGVFSETEVEEPEIDVAAKVKKTKKEKAKTTGTDITIDKLLALKGRLIKEKAKEEPRSRLAQEIKNKEEFLESKEELAPPPPAQPEIPAKPKISEPEPERPVVPEIPKKPAMPDKPMPQPVAPVQPVVNPEPVVSEKPVMPPKPEVKQPMIKKSLSESRPKVEDVKFTSKLIGPIDELAALKISDFRRLSKSPEEAVEKIKGKLDLLEDESMIQRSEGIKALKRSPLYKMYADIMNSSMMKGKTFEESITEKETLSLEEFKAIMNLNKSLKF